MNSYTLLQSPVEEALRRLFDECEESIFVVSPFINQYGINVLIDSLTGRQGITVVDVLTSVNPRSLQDGSLDVTALVRLCQTVPPTKVRSLPKLHAKVYVVDDCKAIVTSANLTRGGLLENYEYGILLSDESLVAGISQDMRAYASLGNSFTVDELSRIANEVRELRALHTEAERAQRQTEAGKRHATRLRLIETALLKNRVKERTINAIFAETIRYLLNLRSMSTEELHAHIKDIHSDICDDSIDRVINGQHFGKLWKHDVRNAQVFLRRRGEIELRDGKWRLT
jgi:hypothetical protein